MSSSTTLEGFIPCSRATPLPISRRSFPHHAGLCRVRGGRSHRLRLIHARHKYSGEYLRCRTRANGLRAVCQPAVAYPRRLEDANRFADFFQPLAITRYYSSQATPPTPTDVKRCDGASASDSACPTSRAPLCKEPRSPATATAPIARSSTTATSSPARNTPRQHMPGRGKAPAHRFGGIAAMRVIGPRPSSAAKIRSNY